ncbi:unnamed protein product [Rhodiola kirilowii]
MVGKLIYLTISRPDICFAVNQVSQHMQKPKMHHWHMVERLLRYLKGSPGQGIWMGCNGSTKIVGYCDADWAGDRVDRKSTTGYCTFIGGNLVTWKSKKQKVISCSSAEAEYRAMRKLTNELIWIKALLKDLGIESPTPITMHWTIKQPYTLHPTQCSMKGPSTLKLTATKLGKWWSKE